MKKILFYSVALFFSTGLAQTIPGVPNGEAVKKKTTYSFDILNSSECKPLQKDTASIIIQENSPLKPQAAPARIIIDNTKSISPGEYHYVPEMFGSIIADDGDVVKRSKFRFAMYSLPTGHQQPLTMVADNLIGRYGGVRIDNTYYNVTQWGPAHAPTYYLRKYDMDSWEMTEEIVLKDASLYSDCIAADPTTGYVYGCFRTNGVNAGSWEISIADFKNKTPYRLTALHKCSSNDDRWSACAFTTDGTLYAINMNGDLLKIDKTKGTGTKIGSTGLIPYNIGSALVDPDSNRFFYFGSLQDLTSAIYEIDLSTGKATKALILPEGLTINGVVPAAPIPASGAPGAITDARYNFADGNLSGTLTFTVPSKTFAGKTLSGSLGYVVLDNDKEIASGNVTAGQQAEIPLTIDASGLHDLCLYLTNSSGRSPRNFTHKHIGNDRPCRIEDVKLTYDRNSGKVDLFWNPITKGENSAFFRPEEVKYRITDGVTGQILSQAQNECTFTTTLKDAEKLKNHPYKVEAIFRDQISDARESNPAVPGNVELPFVDTFDNIEYIPEGYHVINVAEDLNTWTTYYGVLMCHMSPLKIDMDDWLFTPPVYLEAGKIYQVSADMASRFQKCVERIEVLWGDNNHPSAMTHTGLEAFDLIPGTGAYIKYDNYSFNLIPERTGIHYIAFHGISKADQGSIFLDNLTISAAITPGTPAAVSDLAVTPAPKGAHKSTISFKAPSLDVEKKPLSSISYIEISRDGKVVGTLKNPTPGSTLSFVDTMKYGGWKEYLVSPYNEYGMGQINRKSAFIGAYIPAPVTKFSAVETKNPGEILIRWTPPTTDVYGAPLTPENLTYNLYQSRGDKDVLIRQNIEGDSLVFRACDANSRDFLLFGLKAVSATGEGEGVWSEMMPIGKPYELPYRFSFTPEDFANMPIVRRLLSDVTWEIGDDSTFNGITSADNDNGIAFIYANSPDTQAALYTGKIGIPAESDVMMTVMVYNLYSSSFGSNTNTLEVLASTGNGEWTSVRTIVAGQLPQLGWNKVLIPLRQFRGNGVQLQFLATCSTYPLFLMDDIRVEENSDCDLALEALEGPTDIRMGQSFDLSVKVRNNSAYPQEDYKVRIKVNDKDRLIQQGETIKEGEAITIPFKLTFLPDDLEKCSIIAEVECEADKHLENNISAELNILNRRPGFAAPENLSISDKNARPIQLSWSEPNMADNIPESITEDFEGFDPWISNPNISPWTLYDGDQGGIGGFNEYSLPGEIKKGTRQSYWVMDDRGSGLNQTFAANSGHKYLAQMYSADLSQSTFTPIACDDWLISPELFGCKQTISFNAKSYVYSMPETFEVLVSSTGNNPENFTLLARVEQAPADWHYYEYEVPAGTKYFAIRCVSLNKFMFFIDDVTCIPTIDEPFELVGYNIYRNGKKINDNPITTPVYSDESPEANDNSYYVTAVYNHGESIASNKVSLFNSGVTLTSTSSKAPVAYYSPDGTRLAAPVKGICIVKYSDGTTEKIIIK